MLVLVPSTHKTDEATPLPSPVSSLRGTPFDPLSHIYFPICTGAKRFWAAIDMAKDSGPQENILNSKRGPTSASQPSCAPTERAHEMISGVAHGAINPNSVDFITIRRGRQMSVCGHKKTMGSVGTIAYTRAIPGLQPILQPLIYRCQMYL